jgi:threonine/homoserine/homoserine lactone efflux protein
MLAIIGWGFCARRRCCLPSSSCWARLSAVDWQPADAQPPATLAVRRLGFTPVAGKQLLLGLGSSLLNPKNALFYLALMTSLLGPDVTLLQQTVSESGWSAWCCSGIYCW